MLVTEVENRDIVLVVLSIIDVPLMEVLDVAGWSVDVTYAPAVVLDVPETLNVVPFCFLGVVVSDLCCVPFVIVESISVAL